MKKFDINEIKNMEYDIFTKFIESLTPDEIIKLSNEIGYPVFTRLCMGKLRHKFVLLQDGAAVIIVNEKGQILLQSRADRNKWGLPGGCQELGETFIETAIREVLEETNLKITPENLELINIVSGPSRRSEYPNGDVVINNTVLYVCKNYNGTIKCNNESKEMKFFDLDNLPLNQHDPDLIEEYKNYTKRRIK